MARVTTLVFDKDSSLDEMGRAFERSKFRAVETRRKASGCLPSPYWEADYFYTSRSGRSGAGVEQRIYIGQFTDGTGLSYLNARYYQSDRGQFLSQDSTFLAVGTSKLTEILNRVNAGANSGNGGRMNDRQALQRFLSDPQLMNSYGYARDNPIVNKDPTGEVIPLLAILAVYSLAQGSVDLYDAYNMNIRYADVTTQEQKNESAFKFGLDVFLGGVGGPAAKFVGKPAYGAAMGILGATGDVLDYYLGPQIYKNINYPQVQSQTSIQGRQQYAQNYNAAFNLTTGGATTPSGSSLWVTPSGAVVTFGGQLVAPPPTSKKP